MLGFRTHGKWVPTRAPECQSEAFFLNPFWTYQIGGMLHHELYLEYCFENQNQNIRDVSGSLTETKRTFKRNVLLVFISVQ